MKPLVQHVMREWERWLQDWRNLDGSKGVFDTVNVELKEEIIPVSQLDSCHTPLHQHPFCRNGCQKAVLCALAGAFMPLLCPIRAPAKAHRIAF